MHEQITTHRLQATSRGTKPVGQNPAQKLAVWCVSNLPWERKVAGFCPKWRAIAFHDEQSSPRYANYNHVCAVRCGAVRCGAYLGLIYMLFKVLRVLHLMFRDLGGWFLGLVCRGFV